MKGYEKEAGRFARLVRPGGELAVNPCSGLELPAVRGRRERFASPEEAERLIAAAPERDRAVWATAMYAGLRLGELRALRVEDVDLANGVIRVEHGWDPVEGEIELKSHAGRRKVPISTVLRDFLIDHLARTGREGSELIFGRSGDDPFTANRVQSRADDAWSPPTRVSASWPRARIASRYGLSGSRRTPAANTFASLMIAAGVHAKALSTFMGHANISITLDRYGHLMPGSEGQAARLLDAYPKSYANQYNDTLDIADRRACYRPRRQTTGRSSFLRNQTDTLANLHTW